MTKLEDKVEFGVAMDALKANELGLYARSISGAKMMVGLPLAMTSVKFWVSDEP